jgi:hypothetical protein
MEAISAILTGVLITDEDIRARESNDLFFRLEGDVLQKPQDGRYSHRDPNGSNLVFPFFYHFDFSLKKKLNGPLPGHDLKGLKGRVEYKRVTHIPGSIIDELKNSLQLRGLQKA